MCQCSKFTRRHKCSFALRLIQENNYHKVSKFSDTRNLCFHHPKTGKKRFYHRVMHPKDADSIANSEDPDQTGPLGAV